MSQKTTAIFRSATAGFPGQGRVSFTAKKRRKKYMLVEAIDLATETKPLPACCQETRVADRHIDLLIEETTDGDVAE